jgi:hypothetical protein
MRRLELRRTLPATTASAIEAVALFANFAAINASSWARCSSLLSVDQRGIQVRPYQPRDGSMLGCA